MTETTNREMFNPPPTLGKVHFGKLSLFATPVLLEGGAKYVLPGVRQFIYDEDSVSFVDPGIDTEWNGKKKVAHGTKGASTHIIMRITKAAQDGREYEIFKNMMIFDPWYKETVLPALNEAFGANFPINDAVAFVKVEEVGTGDFYQNNERLTWKVVENFDSEALMKVSSDEFFAKFDTADGVPDGWAEKGWETTKGHIRIARGKGQNDEKIATEYGLDIKWIKSVK